MIDPTNRIPAALNDDASDVSEALEIARALWDKGDAKDAIRWVRRAAEAAGDAGQVSRLATLARAAAELEDVSILPPAAGSETRVVSRSLATPPPRSVTPPASARPSITPPPLSSAPGRATTPPPLPARASKPTSIPVSKPASLAPRQPTSSVHPVQNARAPEEAQRTSIRVSVRTSVRDAGLLVVRPLAAGEALPAGTREAFLVMSDAAADTGDDALRTAGRRA